MCSTVERVSYENNPQLPLRAQMSRCSRWCGASVYVVHTRSRDESSNGGADRRVEMCYVLAAVAARGERADGQADRGSCGKF